MHQLLSQYKGLAQLLQSPPWVKNKRNQSQNTQSNIENYPNCSIRDKKIGFIRCKFPQNSEIKPACVSDVDSQEAQRDQDSESGLESSKVDKKGQKTEQAQNVRTRKGPYKKYTTDQKQQAIQLINSGKDIKTVSKQFNIPRRNLLRWRKNGCQRKQGGGRPSDFVMQEKLFEMILKKEVTTQKEIRDYALTMTNFKKFKASKGWYVKFWRRFHEYTAKSGKKEQQCELNIISSAKQQ